MTDALKIAALVILQGVAEFLPISSSGHLAIAGRLLGVEKPGNALELLLHLGTLLAIAVFYRRRIARLAAGVAVRERRAWRELFALAVSGVPAGLCYVLFKDGIDALMDGGARFTGAMLLVTGVLLVSTRFMRPGRLAEVGPLRALAIGLAQAAALLPGISRSGSTMAAARLLGVASREAADFSFMMTLPVMTGAAALRVASQGAAVFSGIGAGTALAAFALSAVTGYFALRLLIGVLGGPRLWLFGLYCLAAGAVALAA